MKELESYKGSPMKKLFLAELDYSDGKNDYGADVGNKNRPAI